VPVCTIVVGRVRIKIALVLLACFAAAVLLRESGLRARLLRSDANNIPANATLMAFAEPRGRRLYAAHCSGCHGPQGLGDPRQGVPNLTDDDWLYGTGEVSDIEQIIRYGIRSYHPKTWNLAIMPAYGTPRPSARDGKIPPLTPTNIRDVVEYLIYLQGRNADAVAAARGASIYAGVGGCYDCHSGDAKGDSAIGAPNLTDQVTLYGDGSRESLSMSISYGRAGICPAWVGRLNAAQVRELAVFVFTLSHPKGH
jgi:cytochrome c oxidase cbb3-type subunit 3